MIQVAQTAITISIAYAEQAGTRPQTANMRIAFLEHVEALWNPATMAWFHQLDISETHLL